MIVVSREFPDFSSPGYTLDSPCPIFGWPTAVLRAFSTQHEYPDHQTAFTFLTNFGGEARYFLKGQESVLQESDHLVLYPGERFSSVVDTSEPVESMYIVFRDADVAAALATDDLALDHRSVVIPSALRGAVSQAHMSRIRSLVAEDAEEDSIEEALLSMLHGVVSQYWPRELRMRPATVVERRKRMEIARERIHGDVSKPLTLDDLAATACLSNFHFLRLFRETFGMTPHQYLLETRLTLARDLLRTTDDQVHTIARKVGFESSTTFSAKFKARFGDTPSNTRIKR